LDALQEGDRRRGSHPDNPRQDPPLEPVLAHGREESDHLALKDGHTPLNLDRVLAEFDGGLRRPPVVAASKVLEPTDPTFGLVGLRRGKGRG
jgi:hypothetical protein